jgi:hypothetical protein
LTPKAQVLGASILEGLRLGVHVGMQGSRRLFVYVAGVMVVRPEYAFASVLERLRDVGMNIVDYDELERRIVLKAASQSIALLPLIVKKYAVSFVFEVKAVAYSVPALSTKGVARLVRFGSRTLFYMPCSVWGVWGELNKSRLLLRLCRKALAVDPAQVPPSLCTFNKNEIERVGEFVEEMRKCAEMIVEKA